VPLSRKSFACPDCLDARVDTRRDDRQRRDSIVLDEFAGEYRPLFIRAAAIRFVGFVVIAAFGKERPLILKAERGSNALA
jgi:hypothetical protein